MKQNSIKQRAKKVPVDIKLLVRKSMSTARKINNILEDKGLTQRDLAVMLGKNESEISKWLQGTHNFTYMTVCKIEAALGEEIITTSVQETPIIIYLPVMDSLNAAVSSCLFQQDRQTKYSEFENNELSFTSFNDGSTSLMGQFSQPTSCPVN